MMIDEICKKKGEMRRIQRRSTVGGSDGETSFDLGHCKSENKLDTIPEHPLKRKLSRRRV
jgi:hypothetical protein